MPKHFSNRNAVLVHFKHWITIYKRKRDPQDCKNYRDIRLQSNPGKVFTELIKKQNETVCREHLEKNKPVSGQDQAQSINSSFYLRKVIFIRLSRLYLIKYSLINPAST